MEIAKGAGFHVCHDHGGDGIGGRVKGLGWGLKPNTQIRERGIDSERTMTGLEAAAAMHVVHSVCVGLHCSFHA